MLINAHFHAEEESDAPHYLLLLFLMHIVFSSHSFSFSALIGAIKFLFYENIIHHHMIRSKTLHKQNPNFKFYHV